jgi:uncharacterized protein YllA (UPF0747 family)
LKKVIVTGQQIGLLGGPLYTTYKVLGAVSLSRKLKGRAIYWLETNDADFEEINHIEYLDGRGKPITLKWEKKSQGYSCGFIEVDRKLVSLIDRFFDSLRQTEFTGGLREMALRAYQPGKNLGQASLELAQSLFAGFGVEVFNPQDRDFIKATRDLLLREAYRTPSGSQCNLFCIIDKKRVAIFRQDSEFFDRDGNAVELEKYDLVPNVKTRNIIQDQYFHTHSYLVGSSEMGYIRDLARQYAYYGINMPEVVPRMSVTLIEPKVRRILDQFEVKVSEVLRLKKDIFLKQIMEKYAGFDYQAILAESRRRSETYLESIAELGLDNRELRRVLSRSVKKSAGLRRAEVKKQLNGILDKANFLFDHLIPFGKKQERVFNLFTYMNLFGGSDFLKWLSDHYDMNLSVLEIKNEN